MRTVTFTEFRRNASRIFSAVEDGEQILVMRHGKAIAEITPASQDMTRASWKRPGLRLSVKGAELSAVILKERNDENIP